MSAYTEEVDDLASDWFRRCRESQMAHYEYASLLEGRHLWIGFPTIILATLAGTAIFSKWTEDATDSTWRVIFGLISLAAACLSALQTFLSLSERAAKHRSAGARYGATRRKLELLKKMPPELVEDIRTVLSEVKFDMDDIAATSPGIPSAFKKKIDDRLKSHDHDRIFSLKKKQAE